jgi:hypothetical protein
VPLKGIVGLPSLLFCFLTIIRWADLLNHSHTPAMMYCATIHPKQWAKWPWTETFETMSKINLSSLLVSLCQVFVTASWLTTS